MRPCSMGSLKNGGRAGALHPDLCWGPANLLECLFWDSGYPFLGREGWEVEAPLASTPGPSSASLGRGAWRSRRQLDGAHRLAMSWPRPLLPTEFPCWGPGVTPATGPVFPLQQEEEEDGEGVCKPCSPPLQLSPVPDIYSVITPCAYKIPK